MDLLVEPLGYGIFVRALLAVVLVATVCAVVGTFVVLRGLAFVGDAIAHAAFPGVVVAFMARGPYVIGAAVAAVLTALGIAAITRRTHLRADTTIGVLFAGTFALGIFLYSTIDSYVGDLFGFLLGNVLAISEADLIGLAILALVVLLTVGALWKELLYATFDPLSAAAAGVPVARVEYLFLALVALAVVVSLQAVGVILVVALLVTPPATAQLLSNGFGRVLATSVGIGVACSIAGLYASYHLDVASGATIVLAETLAFAIALLLSPSRGFLTSRLRAPAT